MIEETMAPAAKSCIDAAMTNTWFICNSASGSYDATKCDSLAQALGVTRRITIPDDDMPDASVAKREGAERIVIFTGDGTVSSAVEALEGWHGELLILPGGTMNLLSRKLHGEATPEEIVERLDKARACTMPILKGAGQRSLVGIIAGPTSAWGDVREAARRFDLKQLVETVPEALRETFEGDLVSLKGDGREFQAIFLDATDKGVEALGVSAANAAEVAQHGIAWLMGDFLGGPSEALGFAPEWTVETNGRGDIGLLVDGERASVQAPCSFALAECPVRFLSTVTA